MLIDSKFHDYYDTIRAWGIDKAVVYKRAEVEYEAIDKTHTRYESVFFNLPGGRLNFPRDLLLRTATGGGRDGTFEARPRIIGFCGRIYPTIELGFSAYSVYSNRRDPIVALDAASVVSFCDRVGVPIKRDRSWFYRRNLDPFSLDGLATIFSADTWAPFLEVFRLANVPTFVLCLEGYRTKLTTNPQLKGLGFASVRPPAQAFQEIYHYISGVLGVPARPTVELSDKDKAKKKGHDGKYSFRKPPTKRAVK